MSTENTSDTSYLLQRVGALRNEVFDIADAIARSSTRLGRNSALRNAATEMQGLANTLGNIERLLAQPSQRAGRTRLTVVGQRFSDNGRAEASKDWDR